MEYQRTKKQEKLRSITRLTGSNDMMSEIFSFIDCNTILRTMVAVNRRFRNIIIKQSGFMQAARVIFITGKSIRTVMENYGVNFRQAAVRVLAKAFEYA
jgi:hypothetical protein